MCETLKKSNVEFPVGGSLSTFPVYDGTEKGTSFFSGSVVADLNGNYWGIDTEFILTFGDSQDISILESDLEQFVLELLELAEKNDDVKRIIEKYDRSG